MIRWLLLALLLPVTANGQDWLHLDSEVYLTRESERELVRLARQELEMAGVTLQSPEAHRRARVAVERGRLRAGGPQCVVPPTLGQVHSAAGGDHWILKLERRGQLWLEGPGESRWLGQTPTPAAPESWVTALRMARRQRRGHPRDDGLPDTIVPGSLQVTEVSLSRTGARPGVERWRLRHQSGGWGAAFQAVAPNLAACGGMHMHEGRFYLDIADRRVRGCRGASVMDHAGGRWTGCACDALKRVVLPARVSAVGAVVTVAGGRSSRSGRASPSGWRRADRNWPP